jgi:uncharacterized LabA/DUF88 family protein
MRVALFFDGKNFFRGMEDFDPTLELSYDRLSHWVAGEVGGAAAVFAGAYYYTGYNKRGGGERGIAFGKFLRALEFRPGFFVKREPRVRRHFKCRDCHKERAYWTEKRVDARLVADMLQLAAVDAYDCAVLFSGDQDLIPAVEGVRALGKQVWVATWGGRGLSPELRAQCFNEIDLNKGATTLGTGRARLRGRTSTETSRSVAPSKTAVVASRSLEDERAIDDAVYAEAVEACAFFADKGGNVSQWYFVNRWRGSRELPDPATRQASLERLYTAGRLERYEYEDAKKRATQGLRPKEEVK